MADDAPKSGSLLHVIGAAIVGALGVSASLLDDCARVGGHLGGAADDMARIGTHADDLGSAATHLDDGLGAGRLGAVAVHVDDGAGLSDELLGELAGLGLDVADLSLALLDEPAAEGSPAPAAARPRLVVAGVPNPPFAGPVDPLVLLVQSADGDQVERLARGCTTLEHACIVLACPPTNEGCVAGWQATWKTLLADPALRPDSLADALAASPHGRAEVGTSLSVGRMHPTGIQVHRREIR